jgi:disulfide bond formation protein DsbB
MKKLIEYLETPRYLALAIMLVSMAVLGTAYIAEYGFGLRPCILCLYQRVPYAVNISAGFFAFLATFRYPRITNLLIIIATLAFFAGAIIAGFHAGVEYGWWKGLASCGGDIIPKGSVEEMLKALKHQSIVRCDKAAWTLFGISMAGYNFFVSLALGLFSFYFLKKSHAT